ncbi:iron-sulfur cluster carrier protein ApbC [Faucicola mancuniensis]|uniref:iron-sulfur cluster carrier protein ApbC n=1 Tax=Faucicola mancuniensis TaxID=1309795 RepID=UPI003977938A
MFFKKAKKIDENSLNKAFNDYHIHEQPIKNFIQKYEQQSDVLNLNLRLPDDIDVEKIHRELSSMLHLHGVGEINMNVTLYKSEKNTGEKTTHKLPKTTNAMAKNENSDEEPSVTKHAPTQADVAPHPRIRHIIVVASGKGGVGKSTTAVNIALALQKLGKKVGILDADIYGPSVPNMLGVAGVKPTLENSEFVPIDAYGMAILSIGNLLDGDSTPVAWRGAKATGALMQLFNQTAWPNLDYLVIDMPPGTGDIQLTLAQRIPVTGAVVVTTPQHIALLDAQKGIEMFHKTQIPVLGVVENMALHTCSNCGHVDEIFGNGGGENLAKDYQVPLLGKLPLATNIRKQADMGKPSVIADDEFAKFYLNIAENVEKNIGKFAKKHDENRIF